MKTKKPEASSTPAAESPVIKSKSLHPSEDLAAKVKRIVAESIKEVADAAVTTCRLNPNLLPANVDQSLRSLDQNRAKVHKDLPHEDIDRYFEIRDIVNTLVYLAGQAPEADVVAAQAKTQSKEQLDQANELLKTLDPLLQVAVAGKCIPVERVAALASGHKIVDRGNRLVNGAMLLKEYRPQLEGKVLVQPQFLEQAIEVGTAVRGVGSQRIADKKHKNKNDKKGAAVPARMEKRDRVHTLLQQRYEPLRRIGAYLYGDEVDSYFPPLGSRPGTKHTKKNNDDEKDNKDDAATTPKPTAPAPTTPAK